MHGLHFCLYLTVGQIDSRDKAWRGYEGRNQLWVDDMSPGLETTDAKRVSDSEGSIMSVQTV